MREIGYSTIAIVLETWDNARFQVKEFEDEFGHKAVHRCVLPCLVEKTVVCISFVTILQWANQINSEFIALAIVFSNFIGH